MAVVNWNDAISTTFPDEAVDARLQAHFAAEWVSRVGRFVAEPQSDYSHIALRWDDARRGFVAQSVKTGDGGEVVVGLELAPLRLFVGHSGGGEAILELHGKTHGAVGEWLRAELQRHGLAGDKLMGEIPYRLEHPQLSAGGQYRVDASNLACFKSLASYFGSADSMIEAEAEKWAHVKPGASPVLCWPHHFDIASLITLDAGDPKTARSVGIGMSPGDETYAAPYFYINPWPRPADIATLPPPPGGSFWHTEGFFSIIAPIDAILRTDGIVIDFFADGVQVAMQVVDYKSR